MQKMDEKLSVIKIKYKIAFIWKTVIEYGAMFLKSYLRFGWKYRWYTKLFVLKAQESSGTFFDMYVNKIQQY